MDPDEPLLETETRRRRRRSLFRHRRVPVRMLVPNFFTLLGLCAGLTSIRMGIEGRYDLALAAIVFAGCLDGINSFDQFGVELGKSLAQPIIAALRDGDALPDATDVSTRALVAHARSSASR